MKRKDVIRAIQKGTLTANEEYLEWTGGWSIGDSGVEGHPVSVIARRLREYQDDEESLLMERPFVRIREWSEAGRPRGRPRRVVKDANRADVVPFNAKEPQAGRLSGLHRVGGPGRAVRHRPGARPIRVSR